MKDQFAALQDELATAWESHSSIQANMSKKIEVLEGELASTDDQIAEIYVKSQNDMVIELQKCYPGEDFYLVEKLGGREREKKVDRGAKVMM